MKRKVYRGLLMMSALALGAGAVHAQTDLTGSWQLEMSVTLEGEETPCLYQGTAAINQTGSTLTGTAEMSLQSGPASCPSEMVADLTGSADENKQLIVVGTLSGQLGAVDFSGSISPNPGGSGTFSVTQGPFTGETGTWTAEQLSSILVIPTLTGLGLTALVILLLAGGTFVLYRHQPT